MTKLRPQTTILIGWILGILVTAPISCWGQVWSCREGYTNKPEGKTDCQRAGAGTVCSQQGDRYIAPRRGSQAYPELGVCGQGGYSFPSFSSENALGQARVAKDALYSKLSDSLTSAQRQFLGPDKKASQRNKMPVGESQYQDIFSCFSGGAGFGGCSIAELSSFVENTFMQASEALK